MSEFSDDVHAFAACVKRLEKKRGHLVLELSFPMAIALIGQVQLALRHPGNRGEASLMARALLDQVITSLGQDEPALVRLLEKGFDPTQNLPPT